MKNSIKTELAQHVLDLINDNVITNDNLDEAHFYAFNEDHYMIGYFQCSEWLKKHDIGELEGAGICTQYEIYNFGECVKVYDDTEKVVNMLAYIYGEELLNDLDYSTVKQLKKELKKLLEL